MAMHILPTRSEHVEHTGGNIHQLVDIEGVKGNVQISSSSSFGPFKYHMTLREGVSSNRQSTVIWGEEVWPNRHSITFIVAKKSLIYSLF